MYLPAVGSAALKARNESYRSTQARTEKPAPMAATRRQLPRYRHDKPKNLAVVRIEGHDHDLGRYDSSESHEKYHRLLAEWHVTGG